MKQYVITISRQFGSMGRSIAQALAQQLNIDFYDRDIVEETARRMGLRCRSSATPRKTPSRSISAASTP